MISFKVSVRALDNSYAATDAPRVLLAEYAVFEEDEPMIDCEFVYEIFLDQLGYGYCFSECSILRVVRSVGLTLCYKRELGPPLRQRGSTRLKAQALKTRDC